MNVRVRGMNEANRVEGPQPTCPDDGARQPSDPVQVRLDRLIELQESIVNRLDQIIHQTRGFGGGQA